MTLECGEVDLSTQSTVHRLVRYLSISTSRKWDLDDGPLSTSHLPLKRDRRK